MDSNFNSKNSLDRINRIFRIIFILSQFPDGIEKTPPVKFAQLISNEIFNGVKIRFQRNSLICLAAVQIIIAFLLVTCSVRFF